MSNTMSHKGYTALIEYDGEDEIFFGRIAGITDGVNFHGENVAELRAAFEASVEDYVAMCARIGKAPQKPYSGQIMVRVDPQVHARAALAAQLAGKSLNKWVEERLDQAALQTVGA